MEDDLDLDLGAMTRALHLSVPLSEVMGVRITAAGSDAVTVTLPLEGNQNHVGSMTVAALLMAAEMVGGVFGATAFDLPGRFPLVRSVEIDVRRPARTDVRATARLSAEEVARVEAAAAAGERASYVLETVLLDDAGADVARVRASYQVIANR